MNPITAFEPRKAVPALPAADLEIAKDFARASKATATRRVYQKDFARFTAWCDQRRLSTIPEPHYWRRPPRAHARIFLARSRVVPDQAVSDSARPRHGEKFTASTSY
jgi:hypothetical protein